MAKEVVSFDENLRHTAQEMIATMQGLAHCVGIAATQVGVDQRIFAMDTSRRQKISQGLIVIANPVLQNVEGAAYIKEGCLSLPSYLGRVRRGEKATVWGCDLDGEKKTWSFEGLESICAQHEIDHLNGMLFIDRLASLRADLYLRGKP